MIAQRDLATESSMAKVAVSEALFRIADRCVQVMGGSGVARESIGSARALSNPPRASVICFIDRLLC